MRLRVEIDRLLVTLPGTERAVAEEAMAGLGEELRARLVRVVWAGSPGAPLEIGAVSVREESRALDAASLRVLIAERLAGEIVRAAQAASAPAASGDES